MKKLLLLLAACALVAGCDFTVPLVKKPELNIETALLGLWQTPKGDGMFERLLMLPLGPQEYLLSYPAGAEDAMFARACLCRVADEQFLQIEWFGTARGAAPDDERVFQYAAYATAADTLTLRLINPEAVGQHLATSAELAKAIAARQGDAELLREPMVFSKMEK